MKLYRARNTTDALYYEKQADVPKGTKFEPVEFPFAASPKADFVAWLNERTTAPVDNYTLPEAPQADFVMPAPQPAPQQPDPSHAAQIVAFEDEWERFPLARKLHFAAKACEDAREAIR